MIHVVFLYSCFLLDGLFGGVKTDEINVSVMEGGSFTLPSGLTVIHSDDEIEWRFGSNKTRITRIAAGNVTKYDDERFRDRLQLERQTGDLTITNVRQEHSGVYQLSIIISNKKSIMRFGVTVYAPLPAPVIFSDASQCSLSPESSRIVLCSVLNVSHVTLSWYKGMSVLSSISVSNISISLSLPLDVEYQDNNTYSCVINNPVRNQTTHLDNITQLCQPCAEQSPRSYFIPVVVSSVFLAIIAVSVVIVFWHIKIHKPETPSVETEEIHYATTTFSARHLPNTKRKEEDEIVYSSVMIKEQN